MAISAELQDRAYWSIRQKILDGRVLKPRDLSRRALQVELGVSSTCVQVALARLEGERLLESRPQSGTFVRTLSFEEYCEYYEVRACIEPHAAGQAARRIAAAQLKLVEQSLQEYAAVTEHFRTGPATMTDEIRNQSLRAERLFHGTILEASGNMTAARIVETLSVENYNCNQRMSKGLPPAIFLNLIELAIKDHRRILTALAAGDARKAEHAMRHHLRRAYQHGKALKFTGTERQPLP